MALLTLSPTVIGSIAAICTTAAFVPQVVRVWRLKTADEISMTTFVVFAVGTFVWLIYGLQILSAPVVIANAVTLAIAITIVLLKLSYDRVAVRTTS